LRVLVYSLGDGAIIPGSHTLVTVPVDGSMFLVSVEAADYFGSALSIRMLSGDYALGQNYPNPFNPSTAISLSLPGAGEWSISIYNIAGQLVRAYSGWSEAGEVVVTWDGTDMEGAKVASGIYLYRASAGSFTATRRMILAK